MATVTLHADEELLARATEAIARRELTLDQVFERALRDVIEAESRLAEYDNLMKRLSYANAGRKFSRDEMNER